MKCEIGEDFCSNVCNPYHGPNIETGEKERGETFKGRKSKDTETLRLVYMEGWQWQSLFLTWAKRKKQKIEGQGDEEFNLIRFDFV